MDTNSRGQMYQIVGLNGEVEAAASFTFKEHIISMSTMGYKRGGAVNTVVVFDSNNVLVSEHDSVEQAIRSLL